MLCGVSRRDVSFASAPPPMLYIVQLSTTLPAFSPRTTCRWGGRAARPSAPDDLGRGERLQHREDRGVGKVAFAGGSQRPVQRHAVGVRIVTAFGKTFGSFLGPIVWLLDGPLPILYNSLSDSIVSLFSGQRQCRPGAETNLFEPCRDAACLSGGLSAAKIM